MNDVLLGLIISVIVLLWSLTWFWARDWDFDGPHFMTPVFGSLMVISGCVVVALGGTVFAAGVHALL